MNQENQTVKFIIPYPKDKDGKKAWNKKYGLNAIYAGKHFAVRNKDKDYWHALVTSILAQSKIPHKVFTKPVWISFYWNDNLDLSNHAYMGKMIEDALKGWVIQEDSRKYVQGILHFFHPSKDTDYIGVKIESVGNDNDR